MHIAEPGNPPTAAGDAGNYMRRCPMPLVAKFAWENSSEKAQPMETCFREFATRVAGYGIAGCVAPIGEIAVTGMMDSPAQHILQERERAIWLAHEAAERAR